MFTSEIALKVTLHTNTLPFSLSFFNVVYKIKKLVSRGVYFGRNTFDLIMSGNCGQCDQSDSDGDSRTKKREGTLDPEEGIDTQTDAFISRSRQVFCNYIKQG